MYAQYYNLTGVPFQLTPDSRFYFGSSGHSRAIAHLVYGLAQEEGFIIITGEVGAGKTTLVEQLWSQLDRKTYTIARVVTTQVSGDDLLRLVCNGFGITTDATDKATLLQRLEWLFRDQRDSGRRCLLVVDEVQSLSIGALEELRMLSNLTAGGRASLQTILLGQPQFRATLASPQLDQLRQRVLASYHLGPLSAAETKAYIEHRLRTVGWTDDPGWDADALAAIHRQTGGIPRRINTLCSRILVYGALEGTHQITEEVVNLTASELSMDLGAGQQIPQQSVGGLLVTTDGAQSLGVGPDHGRISAGSELARRIQALEDGQARQERIFRRLLDLVGSFVEPSR